MLLAYLFSTPYTANLLNRLLQGYGPLYFGDEPTFLEHRSWLPMPKAVYEVHYALHEWLGRLWYRFRDSGQTLGANQISETCLSSLLHPPPLFF